MEDLSELKALVVGFLQQTLKEYPRGFTIQEFERKFPATTDEPSDWYKRYNKKNTLEALECIQDDINLKCDPRYGTMYISLNLSSKAVDPHMVDLITNQRSSKKSGSYSRGNYSRPSHRILASRSFSLNKQYSSGHSASRSSQYQQTRLNHDQQYRGDQFIRRRSSPLPPPQMPLSTASSRPPSIYDKAPTWIASNDPRQNSRASAASLIVPPPVRQPSQQQLDPRASSTVARPIATQSSTSRATTSAGPATSVSKPPVATQTVDEPEVEQDPEMVAKKSHLRQRLASLLMRRSAEIKIFHLNSLYQLEYGEELDVEAYNHKTLATLLQDAIIKESIQINYKTPFSTISIRQKIQSSDKENTKHSTESNGHSIPTTKDKLNAVDPFNVRPMLQSLEPLGQIKEPPLKNIDIDDIVKYRTMRMVFKSQCQTMKLDDWELKFEQENRLRIRIRDYGCRTVFEFFKRLSVDLPIKVELQEEQWVAVADLERLTPWLKEKMEKDQYRALTAIDARYDLIAFPDDTYTYTEVKDILHPTYQPAHILSVKRADSMWIQLRTPKRIEDQLCVEASLTCYEDFSRKKLLPPPRHFIKPGFPCSVFDKNMAIWCRGLVLKVEKRGENYEINTLLVDYGIERSHAISQLMCLMKTHLKFPIGSIYSKLHGVHDDKTNSIKVQRYAKMILQEYTNPPVTLACKFLSSAPAPKNPSYLPNMCAEVTLVDTRQGKDCNLADDINVSRDSYDNDDGSETPTSAEPTSTFNYVIDQ